MARVGGQPSQIHPDVKVFGPENSSNRSYRVPKGAICIGLARLTYLYIVLYNVMYDYLYGSERMAMAHVSYTELRGNLAAYMDQVCDDRAALVVTRQNARSVVMLSEEEYEGLLETVHLLKSPANAVRLLRSIKEADEGKLVKHELIEPDSTG